MVHGNVGQSDLTREDMTRYIRYLVDVIGKEQKTLYSHLEDRTNPYICLHGECQTLANWISVLLEAYGESFTRWDMRLHFTVFGKRYSESTEAERPKQFDDWNVFNIQESGAYLHTLIEWDGLYWDANGGGTRREKEEYYEGMAYLLDGKRDRKRLLFNFIDWEEFKAYLDWPLTTDALDYEWEWVEIDKDWNWFLDSQGIYEGKEIIITDLMDLEVSNLAVFRDFINHLRMDDFTSETVPDWKIHSEVQRLHHREEDFYEGDIEERIEEFREYELQDIPFDLIHAPWGYDSDLVFDYAMQINEYDAMSHEGYDRVGDEWIVVIDPYHDTSVDITNDYPPLVVTSLYAPDPSEPWNKQYLIIDGQHRYEAIRLLRESAQEQGKPNKYDTVKAWVGKGRRAWITQPRDERGRFIRRAERIYFDDEYGGFIKGNPRANELPGEVAFPGEEERLAKIMSPEEYAELEQEVNLIVSNLPYNVESLSEDERIALHEDIILKIVNHEYIHQSIDDEVLEWAIENNKTKGDYYAAHEIMAYVDMALRESLGMRDFKLQLTSLVSQHPILTDNPDLADRVMDALTRTRKGQRFQVPAEIETLMRAFQAEDYEILVVGGAVRDMLMGLKPKDYDLATNATPEDVESVVSTLEGYRTVTTPEAQMARGVLTTLVLPPSGEVIEVTTFRAELGYEEGTRRPVAVAADTFYEDSLRRDFTMNALGWRLNGTILDYHEGVDDIEFGQLVAVGDASERLEEDPLRILRAVRFASRYGLEIDDELGAAIETNLPQLLTLSPERIRRELDTILKSEEGVYDLFETGILENIIPEYKGIYWGERHYDELPVITSVRSYGQIDRELTPYEQGLGWKSEPWQPAVAYSLLLQGRLTREEFNEQYRRGPISFSKAEADMIAELIELYPVALESEDPRDVVAIVTSPYYAELMLMLEYTSRLDLVDSFKPYRQRYKGKPPKGYAMTVADEYGIEPGPALGDKISEITEAIILGDIEDWEEGLNYYAAEEVGTRERIAYAGVILDEDTSEQLLARFESEIPEFWTQYAHHMTVSLGKSIPNQADLGKEVTLTVTAVGKSDDAIAVAVSGYPSRNTIPHITLAVPPGGKPFNSNKITDWHSVEPFAIHGQLQDVKTYVAEEIIKGYKMLNYPRGHSYLPSESESVQELIYKIENGENVFIHDLTDEESFMSLAKHYEGSTLRDCFTCGVLTYDWSLINEGFECLGCGVNDEDWSAETDTLRSESSRDWSLQYTWQPVPVEDFMDFRRNRYSLNTLRLDDILNLKTLYRGTRKPSSIREGMFDFFGGGEINESEQIPETVYFYTWERPYPTEQWERHNAEWECACDECNKYAFNYGFANSEVTGLIRSAQFKPEWEETPEGSEVVRVLFIPHLFDEIVIGNPLPNSRNPRSHVTRNNLTLEDYGFEPVIWSERRNKNYKGGFYASPHNMNLRALEQRLGRGFPRTLNYPRFSSESMTKYAESFWGDAGSGVLVVARDTQRILLGLRSEDVNEPNTWGNFGGAIGVTDFGEPEEALPPEENALKEMAEEIGYTGTIEMMPSFTYRSPEFTYYNFIGIVEQESDVPLNQFNWEVSELQWFTLAEIMALPNLHFGVSALMSQEEMITFNGGIHSDVGLEQIEPCRVGETKSIPNSR